MKARFTEDLLVDELERLKELRPMRPDIDEGRVARAREALDQAISASGPRGRTRGTTSLVVRRGLATAAAVALGVAGALIVFGSDDDSSQVGLSSLFSAGGEADYEPADSPRELAQTLETYPDLKGQIGVRGSVAGFEAGRTYEYVDDPPGIPTVVLALAVDEVLLGELPEGSDGRVYVEVEVLGSEVSEAVKTFEGSLPPGTEILAYLAPAGAKGPYPGTKIENDGAGHPPGQPLFRIYTPQGLYVADAVNGDVVQPEEDTVFPNSSLNDFEPSAEAFPPGEFNADVTLSSSAPD